MVITLLSPLLEKAYLGIFTGLSRSAILDSVEASLERLQTQYIDLLQIHHFDPATPIEETMETLHDLVKSSKVRYIGACSMWAYQFARMQFTAESRRWTKFISMQNNYSLLYREEEREMIPFCQATGVGLIPVCFTVSSSVNNLRLTRSIVQAFGERCSCQTIEQIRPNPSFKRLGFGSRGRL